ncbi:MAG: acyl-homoserine-lactone synthase [Bosea sp. (in: a-proteobacteria)]
MRLLEINRSNYGTNYKLVYGMHRLRSKVFKDRLEWTVCSTGEMEMDHFDTLRPDYLVVADGNAVLGSVRLLPTTGPNMLAVTFPELLDGAPAPRSETIAESSRFCVDTENTNVKTEGGLRRATFMLFAGMLEWAEQRHQEAIATVTDARMERILRRAGWPLERLGTPRTIGPTVAVAGLLPVHSSALQMIREKGNLSQPVLASLH